jgi:hypothetical protein
MKIFSGFLASGFSHRKMSGRRFAQSFPRKFPHAVGVGGDILDKINSALRSAGQPGAPAP